MTLLWNFSQTPNITRIYPSIDLFSATANALSLAFHTQRHMWHMPDFTAYKYRLQQIEERRIMHQLLRLYLFKSNLCQFNGHIVASIIPTIWIASSKYTIPLVCSIARSRSRDDIDFFNIKTRQFSLLLCILIMAFGIVCNAMHSKRYKQ